MQNTLSWLIRYREGRYGNRQLLAHILLQYRCRSCTLKLPLTPAIMPGRVFENEKRVFVVPWVDIEELVCIRARDVDEAENGEEA